MIGIDNRTTMDMDTTVKGIPLKKDVIKNIVLEILDIKVDDGICFEVKEDSYLKKLWEVYIKDNPYIKELDFLDVIEVVKILSEKVEINGSDESKVDFRESKRG